MRIVHLVDHLVRHQDQIGLGWVRRFDQLRMEVHFVLGIYLKFGSRLDQLLRRSFRLCLHELNHRRRFGQLLMVRRWLHHLRLLTIRTLLFLRQLRLGNI